MSKKLLILILVVLLIVGIAAYLLFFKNSPKPNVVVDIPKTTPDKVIVQPNQTNPITGGLGAGTGGVMPPTPTPPAVLPKLGEKVVPIRRTQMFNGSGLVTGYTAGGNDGTGFLNAGYYAGKIIEVNPAFHSVKVENFTTRAKIDNWLSADQEFNTYWLNINDLKKQ